MKPKQNNKNKGNNNKRLKQQQQQQQQKPQQQASVGDEVKGTINDDVTVAETGDVMTSSVVEHSKLATTRNAERHIPADNSADNPPSIQSASGDADHVTDMCPDDVTSDVEVADNLQKAPAVNPDLGVSEVTEVTEVMTSDPRSDDDVIKTEVIMSKTFTESTHPDSEFVPIRGDTDDDVINPLPAAADPGTTLTVRCELLSQPSETTSGSSRHAVTSSERPDSVGEAVKLLKARGEVRDLTSGFRHLQSLLDNLESSAVTDMVDSSSEEELGDDEDWRQPSSGSRVVYRYHLREQPLTTRRWIRRDDDATRSQELNTQTDLVDVVEGHSETHHEKCLEPGSQGVEEQPTQPEEPASQAVKEVKA